MATNGLQQAVDRLRSVLVKLFGWACESALLTVNPMLGVKKPHREGKGKTRTLTDGEIRVLWHVLGTATAAPGIVAAIKSLLARARNQLREQLEPYLLAGERGGAG